jgi:exonuclease VII small subunit
MNPMKRKQMEDQARQLEDRIANLEGQIQQSEMAFSDFPGPEQAARLASLLETQRAELDRAMAEWEAVTEEIEATA